jgi:hypothetical protein
MGSLCSPSSSAYGYHWWTVGRFIESTDDAYGSGDVTLIAPKVAGFIAEVAVTDNQFVHAGDLLVCSDHWVAGGDATVETIWPRSTGVLARPRRCHRIPALTLL